ncbi:MAG: DUF5103 domain-containing protein [Bacteroidales bacterium]
MRKIGLLITLLCVCMSNSLPAQLHNQMNKPSFRSLQIRHLDNWLRPPVIQLHTDEAISISFDDLASGQQSYYYSIVHCNRDWTPSQLSEMEYLNGFNNNLIEEVAPSFNTYVPYFHYRIQLPNDKISFALSGNYVCQVYSADRPDEILLTARFYVAEKAVQVASSFSSDTDLSFRKDQQQISVRIQPIQLNISTPQTDIAVAVEQNNRPDTRRLITSSVSVRGNNQLVYEHNRDLIFEGGNEYRRFEIVSFRYPGLKVDKIRFADSLYMATLIPDEPRNDQSYYYDRDQNGRYLVRDVNAGNNDTESDYFRVCFTLPTDLPYINGRIYLMGEFTQNRLLPEFEVRYNSQMRTYLFDALLKEGAYNYMYVMVPNDTRTPSVSPIEGSHYETENEYLTLVYYRPQGARYDRIVGHHFLTTGK